MLTKIKDEFVGIASHDLRAPLAQIIGSIDLLLFDDVISGDGKKILKNIKKVAKAQLEYTDDILQTIFSGKLELNLNIRETKIFDLIKACTNNFKTLANSKNIKFEINSISNTKKKVNLDPQKINQVINNLLSNAIKFSKPSGKIFISYFINKNNELEIRIQDFGHGIESSKINNLFLEKVSSSYGTNGEKGTGFGLTICKKFVELHGGEIGVISHQGKGTTFWFTIPKIISPSF